MSDTADVGTGPTLPRTPSEGPAGAATVSFDSLKGSERFSTGDLIGKGGMGEVFGCTDLRLKRPMAVKQATSRSPLDLERFVREARVQGQLQHPSIVPVHELGLTPEGLPYFTMKRVRGETLSEVLEALFRKDAAAAARHTRRRLLGAFGSVCQAIEFAHTQGVLHRDLKPANVMLGDFGEVYVLDWGLAKPLDQVEAVPQGPLMLDEAILGATPTVAGSLLGTPGYMSPELVVGKPASVQSDVFALGSMLFEMLALERMIAGDTVVEILTRTRDGFECSLRQRYPQSDVAPEFDLVVKKACARDPAERFASVRALHEAVERILAGERDLELRAELARAHARNAAEEVAKMRHDQALGDEGRQRALQEVGRSLALDPNNDAAAAVLLELLQTPPKVTPDEVKAAMRNSAFEATRRASLMATWGFIALATFLPWLMWMGVRHSLEVTVLGALTLIGAAASFGISRMSRPPPELTLISVMAFMFIGGVLNVAALPFVVGPPVIIASTVIYMTLLPARLRWFTVASAVLALAAPFWCAWLGISATPLQFAENGLTISSRLVFYGMGGTTGLILDSMVGTVVLAAIAATQTRKTLERAQERIAVQAWNLRQLLPPKASHATLLDDTAADPTCALKGFFEGHGLKPLRPPARASTT